jgi:hypothetical protein
LNRKTSGDSLKTPLIDSAVVRWNVKPRFKCIDSVVTGTGTLNNVNFGDTLHLLARKDTANLFLSVYDPDHADIIRIQGSGA